MRIDALDEKEVQQYCSNLARHINKNYSLVETKYLDLGVKTVRLLTFSKELIPIYKKQLDFVLKDNAKNFDETIIFWQEKDLGKIYKYIVPKLNPKTNFKRRIETLILKEDILDLEIFYNNFSKTKPVLEINNARGILNFYDNKNKTYFCAFKNSETEEIIKEGHIFVQILNKILKTPKTNLAHGAVLGLNNKGILLCARGQRGKSTLAVQSLLKGFEFVSDDYLTLEKRGEKLVSHPIYSIITLSAKMYNELYNDLKGARFVSNNARKDKYVFNISNFHKRFKTSYPVEVCVFPEISHCLKPSIKICSKEEKSRAVAQLIHSTLVQTGDLEDSKIVLKMVEMVKNFEFYKLNLSSDIKANSELLKDFILNFKSDKTKVTPLERFCLDITFDLANIVDTKTGAIYSFNKFATDILKNLLKESGFNEILEKLQNQSSFKEDFKKLLNETISKEKTLLVKKHYNNICTNLI